MIGVITKESEKETAREFFELFKTPWEFYKDNRSYDIVLITDGNYKELNSKLTVIYGSNINGFDNEYKIGTSGHLEKVILEYNDEHFPVNGRVLTFSDGTKKPLIRAKETDEVAGVVINLNKNKILRVGFDLFQEVKFLLSSGQHVKHASIPTLEMHISMLRDWILYSGVLLVEIPPVPAGHAFITCLTHDVDFVGIRKHIFDYTLLGFIYRAFLRSLLDAIRGRCLWSKAIKNWKAVISLPFVYLGIMKDFMVQFDRYIKIEKGINSTFFIIPFKNHSGYITLDRKVKKMVKRASKYDVNDIIHEIKRLVSQGCEIGLHGIDAWHDSKEGRKELERISQVTGESNVGVRMHWLYYYDQSPQQLENSKFFYDATFGYNDAVGFRGGTTQVFRPLGTQRLMELPLHIQDTALFYPLQMNLTETKAMEVVGNLLKVATKYGGVLTINWHHRSIGPERFWDDFYINMLDELKKMKVWFGTASKAVEWFNKRRSVSFNNVSITENEINIQVTCKKDDSVPDLVLRVHKSRIQGRNGTDFSEDKASYTDIPFTHELDTSVSMC